MPHLPPVLAAWAAAHAWPLFVAAVIVVAAFSYFGSVKGPRR